MPKPCTRCLLKDYSKEVYERLIVEGLKALPAEDLANGDVTAARLSVCEACEKLNQGTCLACGCYVKLRAAGKEGKCPLKRY